MNRKKIIITFICLIGFTSINGMKITGRYNQHVPVRSGFSPATAITIAVASTATAVACYGLYRLGQWLFEPSDEKLLEKANNAYHDAYARYNIMHTILKSADQAGTSNNDIIYNFVESVLYQLAVEKHYEASVDPYLRQLNHTIKSLENYKKKITQRTSNLYTTVHTNSDHAWLYDHMQALLNKITAFLPNLLLLRDFLKHHKSYFTLFELESSLLYRYNQELNALNSYPYDQIRLNELFHRCIMMHHNNNRSHYPYISYADMISDDIDELNYTIGRLAYNYAERIYYAQDLYNKLGAIKGIVVSAKQYHTELIEREKAQRRDQQLAIQQQQLQAMQQQNYLHEQALRLQEQQGRRPNYTYKTEVYL